MKKTLIFLCAIIMLPSMIFAQDPQQAPQAGAAPQAENTEQTAFRERLIDFDVLGQNDATDLLALENWNVTLNPSSDFLYDKRFTYSKKATSQSGKNFLGFRAHFPKVNANSYAVAAPRYALSFYDIETGQAVNAVGRGVITNVGALKSSFLRVAGRNYPHKAIVNLVRNNGEEIDMDFGTLLYVGWKTLRWNNPSYLSDFRDRQTAIYFTPLYPRLIPSIKFSNLIIFRDKEFTPGNFITYAAWVDLVFDHYYSEEEINFISTEEDFINDEDVWKIIQRETGSTEARLLKKKVDDYRRLERLERQKMNLPAEGPIVPNGAENIEQQLP